MNTLEQLEELIGGGGTEIQLHGCRIVLWSDVHGMVRGYLVE